MSRGELAPVGNENQPTWWEQYKDKLLRDGFYGTPEQHEHAWQVFLSLPVDIKQLFDETADYEQDEALRESGIKRFMKKTGARLDLGKQYFSVKRHTRTFLADVLADVKQKQISSSMTLSEFLPYVATANVQVANDLIAEIFIQWEDKDPSTASQFLQLFVSPGTYDDAENEKEKQLIIFLGNPIGQRILKVMGLKF